MRRPHIALFTNLGHGHVYPALGVCRELVRRGYRVTYATDKHYARQIHSTGAEPVVFDPARLEAGHAFTDFNKLPPQQWWPLLATIALPWFFVDATVAERQLHPLYDEDRPDLILYDRFAFVGRILAKRYECPAIQTYPHFAYYKRFIWRDKGVFDTPIQVLEFGRLLDLFLSAYGIEEKDNLWHTERLNIYFIPREFQYHPESFDERSCFVGPCLNRLTNMSWRNRSGGKPIILVYDMSASADPGYFNDVIAALSGLDCHLVISIGDKISRRSLRSLTANVEVNQYESHLEILPHVSLVLGRPGMGSSLEAIWHGVPIVALPSCPAHDEIAYRIEELGLGVALPREPGREIVRESVQRALNDTALRDRTIQMSQVFKNSGGASAAVDRIQEFLG